MSVHRSTSLFALAAALALSAPAFAADPAPDPNEAGAAAPDDAIIVTGTRVTGITAAESAAPIKLVSADAISHVGQPNLNQVLTQLVPSFTAQAFGGDAANLTLSAALRGLNPNQTLVLLNGKRRHGTANLQVLSSAFQGGAAPDLDYITPASIDHVEVLTDGASAQYGSDAIAGVINIILKKKAGGQLSATGGQYYDSDGETASTSLNYGITNDRGYLNLTAFYRFHNFSQRGAQDIRVLDPVTGAVGGSGALASDYQSMKDFPRVNPIVGDARSHFAVGSLNAGFDATDHLSFYAFGTLGYRNARPMRMSACPTVWSAPLYSASIPAPFRRPSTMRPPPAIPTSSSPAPDSGRRRGSRRPTTALPVAPRAMSPVGPGMSAAPSAWIRRGSTPLIRPTGTSSSIQAPPRPSSSTASSRTSNGRPIWT